MPRRTTEDGRIVEAMNWFLVCKNCGCQVTDNRKSLIFSTRPHTGPWTASEPVCEAQP